jgi:hypothetical protein
MRPCLVLGAALVLAPASAAAQEPPRVVPVYLVPRDYAVPLERVPYHIRVLDDVRRWYARVTGGRSFVAEPLIVQVSRHSFAELAADSFQAWWPLLQREFADYGFPWNQRSRIKLLFLTNGAGAWAGADSENGGIDSIGAAGKTDDGDWGGLAVIGDSSAGGVFAGVCPETAVPGTGERGRGGGTAWWCSGTTYRGTVGHELGHTFGLPHPDAFRQGFRCADSTAYTLMQCHWEYARERLLDYEIAHLRSLSFFAADSSPAYEVLGCGLMAVGCWRGSAERGDSLVWVDGRGGGTGYPWAVVLRVRGARVVIDGVWKGPLAFDLGLPRGATRPATLRLARDGRPVALYTIEPGAPPQRVMVQLVGVRQIELRVVEGGAVVLGNARVYR